MEINGWRLIERIGAGGMGEVWRARHARLGVGALKLLREELLADREARSRFRREAMTLQRIQGLCTGRVLDVEVKGSSPYIVTEYVAGPTLRAHIAQDGPITDDNVLQAFALGLADALVAVHDAGVVHRDLTATNVLMANTGPKVVDFGIARYVDASYSTTTVFSIGTPGWMSPEQILGDDVGPPSDMFCWGLLVCYAAGGRNCFGIGSPEALLYRIVHAEPSLPGLPSSIAPLAVQALDKHPPSRPTAAQALLSIERSVGATTAVFLDHVWPRQAFEAAPRSVAVNTAPIRDPRSLKWRTRRRDRGHADLTVHYPPPRLSRRGFRR
jgi:serine/threonine protein kinase